MIKEGLKHFKVLEPNNLINELISFIENELPGFPTSNEFVKILGQKKNENQHSLTFCVYMTNKCQSKYYFARENIQKGSSVIDIGVYKGSNLIFTIEAKLLPTPITGKKTKREEWEYVYGNGGGIQRFKDGKHGLDNSDNYLSENGLIAFIKEHHFDHWLNEINQWVNDATWHESEALVKIYFSKIGKLRSEHSRTVNKEKIILHHFWVKV